MRILYGVQGTGNGHITRARVMAKALRKQDVDVDFVFSGRQQQEYFDMEIFGDYRTYRGISLATEHGKVSNYQTVKKLRLLQLYKDIKSIDLSDYDLVLNDFEPITAWAAKNAANKGHKVPVVNISHQASFIHQNVPTKNMSWLDKRLLKNIAPADINLGVHWYHFGQTILPPFIEQHKSQCHDKVLNDVLVYLPFENLKEIIEVLNGHHRQCFVVYHPDVKEELDFAAVKLRKPCRDGFLHALHSCSGVIANAGFELSSEALTLGKKLLLKPLQGQFEQSSNAETLSQLGLASVMEGIDEDAIESWLQLDRNESINYPSDPKPVVDWLLQGDYHQPEKLCQQVWQSVSQSHFLRHGAAV